ncbi:MAG TPA: hypothetical protein PLP86_04880 [Armatimonadota bacterium]|nr:hypothetical protein [Armatimonadota bacterium]
MATRIKHPREQIYDADIPQRSKYRTLIPLVAFILTLWLILILLRFIFHIAQNNEYLFMGMIGSRTINFAANDTVLYLDMIEQAQNGALLFSNEFTGEVSRNLYFNSIWLVIGKITGPLGLSPLTSFLIFKFLMIPVFILTLWRFLSLILPDVKSRYLAIFLIAFCGGIGWVLGTFGRLVPWPLEQWFIGGRVPEFNCFICLLISPHITLAMSLMLIAMADIIRCSHREQRGGLVFTAIMFILATFHPYDVAMLFLVSGAYLLILRKQTGYFNKRIIKAYITAIVVTAPVLAYHYWSLGASPDLHGLKYQNALMPTSSIRYLLAILPLGIPAAYELVKNIAQIKQLEPSQLFILTWTLMIPVMLYAYPDIPFAWKLAVGTPIPVFILATQWIMKHTRNDSKGQLRNILRSRTIVALIALSLINNIVVLMMILNVPAKKAPPYYLSKYDVAALQWLSKQPDNDYAVMSTRWHGLFMPSIARKKSFIAHGVVTPDCVNKEETAQEMFSENTPSDSDLEKLREYRVRWVFYGSLEKEWWEELEPSPEMLLRYSNDQVKIFEVIQK